MYHSPGESAGQYSIRMRTVNEDKQGSSSGKSDSEDEKRPSKSRRRGRRSGSSSPKQPEHGVKVHRTSEAYTDVGFTLLYVDNRGEEKPIALADGSEQPQWITVGDATYCGFPGADIAFSEVFEGDTSFLTVRQVSSAREAVYRSMDTSNLVPD